MKITTAEDVDRVTHDYLTDIRTGFGYDVHVFDENSELWLGGIKIPHKKGLKGHSDADVALHALTDAILGAIGEGDIGTHFPPSDSRWKGARSDQFLRHANELVKQRGGIIGNVDLTIICEAPKISPHREEMKTRISQILGIEVDRVSVKGTTTEKLGFTGREEGIAAKAVATVRLPI
ncbi:2-C-methyl-D-erythritol 2,4-cyclodiphosphate synthase [Sneathiella glossodoripedis]|uniref:2-C-methyl-D-erythritol 2,4-cyclodiphosphate synthase n=1 Tax=Sneathiella glossodoripedis TaxID=418853 RepID=UPI000ADB9360|nr:2-C-methyl-D-erythritol 2,4-cyclodiphosphate synthase [Sneathiella glossodoripedis]